MYVGMSVRLLISVLEQSKWYKSKRMLQAGDLNQLFTGQRKKDDIS